MEQAQDGVEPIGRIAPALAAPAVGTPGEAGSGAGRRAPRRAPAAVSGPAATPGGVRRASDAPGDAGDARPTRGRRIDERA